MSWEKVKLGELCGKVATCNPIEDFKNNEFFYFDISSVNPNTKCAEDVKRIAGNDAPSRARQLLKYNDIIVSTVRPNLNAISRISDNYKDGVASTGFCVLRTKNEQLDNNYLFYWLQSKLFIDEMVKLATGASYPAVSDTIIKNSLIPLPPLPIQKKIAEILDKADALRKKDQQLLQKYDELAQAIFIDMFGDPVKNEKGWEMKEFGSCIEYIGDIGSNGSNATISENIKMLDDEDYAIMIRTTNLNSNNFVKNLKYVSKITYDFFSKSKIFGGEIIMNKIGSAGDFWIMPFLNKPVSLGLNQLVIRLKNLNTTYLYYYLSSDFGKSMIKAKVNGAVTKSITKSAVKSLPILYPKLDIQNKFAEIICLLEKQKRVTTNTNTNELFQSLLQKAFKGELIA